MNEQIQIITISYLDENGKMKKAQYTGAVQISEKQIADKVFTGIEITNAPLPDGCRLGPLDSNGEEK